MRILRRIRIRIRCFACSTWRPLPNGVWSWPPQERAQRLRYALIGLCAGNHPIVAWPLAFDTGKETEAGIERTLEVVNDAEIERMVASAGPADWKSEAVPRARRL